MFIANRSEKLFLLLLGVLAINEVMSVDRKLTNKYVNIKVNTREIVKIHIKNVLKQTCTVKFFIQHKDVLYVTPKSLKIDTTRKGGNYNITLHAIGAGKSEITTNYRNESSCNIFLSVSVYKDKYILIASIIIGWMYFIAWSITYFPQICSNYKRKSVVGLNFDFVTFNILGHVYYSVFNIALYAIPLIEEQYARRYPRSVNPVLMNDLVYATTVTISTSITVIQCYVYESGNQKVSTTSKIIVWICALLTVSTIVLCKIDVLEWIDFAYFCSYVKLAVTFKYLPQLYMNYKRNSTDGWSIGNVLLDIAGGVLSILQMILNAHNYDDWKIFLENATKFGIGLLTIFFDILFILQHYVLYNTRCETCKEKLKETTVDTCNTITNNNTCN